MTQRRTIRERKELGAGIGLHLGRECCLTFVPAAPGTGIVFRRTDLDGAVIVETDGGRVDVRTMSGRSWTTTLR